MKYLPVKVKKENAAKLISWQSTRLWESVSRYIFIELNGHRKGSSYNGSPDGEVIYHDGFAFSKDT